MKIGLIGTGIIGEAFVHGLVNVGKHAGDIWVSTRSEHRSAGLSSAYDNVTAESCNQKIVDQSDLLILAVLPEQAEMVLEGLTFREEQILFSIVSSITLASLKEWAHPCTKITRGIPLPPIEFGAGPIPICPPTPELEPLLNSVGTVIPLTDESQFLYVAVGSSLMAMLYEMMSTAAGFMEQIGLPAHASSLYATSMMHALAETAIHITPEELQKLSEECLTPGGLNEQVLLGLRDHNWYQLMEEQMEGIYNRLSQY